jgi:hypothetical protein
MAYTTLSDAELSQDQPLTQPKAFAFRDNLFAVANAETGAPYAEIVWHPYDGVTVGDGNTGLIFDHDTDGDLSAVLSPDFEEGYKYRFTFLRTGHITSGSENFEFQPFLETDQQYVSPKVLAAAVDQSDEINGWLEFDSPRSVLDMHFVTHQIGTINNVNAVDFTDNTAQKIEHVRFAFGSVRDIQKGKIFMFRKRDLMVVS